LESRLRLVLRLPDVLRSIAAAGSPNTAPLCMHSICQQSEFQFKATDQHMSTIFLASLWPQIT